MYDELDELLEADLIIENDEAGINYSEADYNELCKELKEKIAFVDKQVATINENETIRKLRKYIFLNISNNEKVDILNEYTKALNSRLIKSDELLEVIATLEKIFKFDIQKNSKQAFLKGLKIKK